LLRRDAREHEGVRRHEQAVQGLMRAIPRQRPGRLLQIDQVLEDADEGLWQRPEQLRQLLEVAASLDCHQELVAVQPHEAGRPHCTPRRRLSAALWRRPWLRATSLLVPPLGWMVVFYLAALAV